MFQKIRAVTQILSTLVVILVVVLAIGLSGVRLVGIDVFTVLSGSMEPAYPTGSLIYVREVEPEALQPGDVITFMLSETTVATHRIVEVVPDAEDPAVLRYRTKGDANENIDANLVHCQNVIGTPVLTIPKLGYVIAAVQKPPGLYWAIAACMFIVVLAFLPELLEPDEEAPSETGRRKGRKGRKDRKAEPTQPEQTEAAQAEETP